MEPLFLTLKVAAFSTLGVFLTGLILAYIFTSSPVPGKNLVEAFLTLPMVLPPTVLGYYLIVVLGRNGFLGSWFYDVFGASIMFTWQGAVLAAAVVSFPLVFKSARAAFEDVDKSLEDAARTLGLSETGIFIKVSLPLAWRGILSGTLLAFARAMGEFGATLMIAGNLPGKTQTLSMAVYDAVQAGEEHQAAMLVLLISIAGVAVLFTSGKLLQRPEGEKNVS